jgi:uncharacterized tellurite resistance protein B-like protein
LRADNLLILPAVNRERFTIAAMAGMIFLGLLKLKLKIMQVQLESILTGYSEQEKAAYIGALAALATSDREASGEELDHIRELAHAAGVSPEQEQQIISAARDTSGQDLKRCLDTLKSSDLRYSLITDLLALAKADENYSEEEKQNIERVAKYLQVDQNQFTVLDQYVNKAAETEHSPEEMMRPGFMDSLGLRNNFSNAGFNMGSMGKSLFGFLGPMILGGLAARSLGGRRAGPGGAGGLGGMLGGMLRFWWSGWRSRFANYRHESKQKQPQHGRVTWTTSLIMLMKQKKPRFSGFFAARSNAILLLFCCVFLGTIGIILLVFASVLFVHRRRTFLVRL